VRSGIETLEKLKDLSAEDKSALLFDTWDLDNDGYVEILEIVVALRKLELTPGLADVAGAAAEKVLENRGDRCVSLTDRPPSRARVPLPLGRATALTVFLSDPAAIATIVYQLCFDSLCWRAPKSGALRCRLGV
jgi:hypothetical protein